MSELSALNQMLSGGSGSGSGSGSNRRNVTGPCAFCSNRRAFDCILNACAHCCLLHQTLYGVVCECHTMDAPTAANQIAPRAGGSSSNSSTRYSDLNSIGLLGLRPRAEDSEVPRESSSSQCVFCSNQRAADCASQACRRCCWSQPGECQRHAKHAGIRHAGAGGRQNVPVRTRPAPHESWIGPPGSVPPTTSRRYPPNLLRRFQSSQSGVPSEQSEFRSSSPSSDQAVRGRLLLGLSSGPAGMASRATQEEPPAPSMVPVSAFQRSWLRSHGSAGITRGWQ